MRRTVLRLRSERGLVIGLDGYFEGVEGWEGGNMHDNTVARQSTQNSQNSRPLEEYFAVLNLHSLIPQRHAAVERQNSDHFKIALHTV
jgi:hypothetical protein